MLRKKHSPKERQSTSRLPFRLFVSVSVVVLLIPLCLVVALHLPSLQKEVIAHLVYRIESEVPIKVELGGYRWWPFSRLRLLNVKVQSAGKDVLQCDQAQVAYRISTDWPYLVPEEIFFEKPVIHLEKDEKGKWQLPQSTKIETGKDADAKPQVDPSILLSFPWPRIRIASGVISATQNGQPVLTIRDVTGELTLNTVAGPDGHPRIRIDLGQWQGLFELPPWGAWHLSGEAEIDNQTLSPVSLVFSLGEKADIACRGAFSLNPPYDVDLKIDLARFSFASFQDSFLASLPRLEETSGTLHIKRQAEAWSAEHEIRTNLGELHGTVNTRTSAEGESTLHWATRFNGLEVSGIPEMPDSDLCGQMEVTLAGERPEELHVELKGRLESSKWGEQTIRKGDISGSYEAGILTVNAAQVQSSFGDFSAGLTADLKGLWNEQHQGELKADLQMERASLEKLLPGVQQRAGGTVHLEASYGPSQIRNWQKWRAKAETMITIAGFTSLKAAGTYKDESMEVDYDLEAGDVQKLSLFLPGWQGKGRLTSKGSLKGQWPDFIWEGTVNAPHLEYGNIQGEQLALSGKGKVIGKEARREATLKLQNLAVDGKRMGSFDLEIEQQGDECSFQVKGEQPWNQLSAKVSGRMEKLWASPRTLTLSESSFTWRGQSGLVNAKLELDDDRVKFHSLNLQEGKQKAHLTGELSWEGKSDLRLALDDVFLGPWLKTIGLKEEFTGVADGQIHITGNAEQPEASIEMQIANAAIVITAPPEDSSPSPAVAAKSSEIKAGPQQSKAGQREVKGPSGARKSEKQAGNRKRTPEKKISAGAATQGVPNLPLQAANGQEAATGKGEQPGRDTREPQQVFREAFERIQLQGSYAREVLQIRGELQGQIAEMPVAVQAKVGLRLSFKPFQAQMKQAEELNSTIKVNGFRVERLLPYLDFLTKAGGRMDVEAQIGGTLAQPVVKVNGIWRDGNFEVKEWPHLVDNIQVEWQADAKQIFIRKAQMKHLGGRVDLTGRVEYPRFRVMEYEATGEDLEIPEFWGIKGRGRCNARLAQTAESASLKADIHLTKAEMNLREFETDLARTIHIVGGETKGDLVVVGGGEKEEESYYTTLKMDLDVRLPASATWVRGNGLESEITGALRLQKAINAPLRLYGGLQALRGTYTFQGNKLTIVDGELAFFGSPQPDPVLKIVCRKEVKDVTIRANVNGPLSQPKFSLSSVPAMNQVDVLSYLLFGHPAGDLNSKQTSQLQNGAASWLGSQTSRVLKSVFGNTVLTPDTFQYHNSGDKKGDGAVIEIGKYVTPDLYVTYEKGVNGEKENQVQLEYRLNRHLSVQTQVGGADRSGVDVFWRYDFGK